jgi:DNA-directed RNA polymerase specialized sigma24 family protein
MRLLLPQVADVVSVKDGARDRFQRCERPTVAGRDRLTTGEPMSDDEQITAWLARLAGNDARAAEAIWQAYFAKLVRYAGRKLEGLRLRAEDQEDVALSAMQSFYDGFRKGRFAKMDNRDDLWKVLVTITARKACAARRRSLAQKRGGGRVRGESIYGKAGGEDMDAGLHHELGSEPTPEFAAMFQENCQVLLDLLQDETLRTVAVLRLQGYSNAEIAAQLGCVERSVERKLERIRAKWSKSAASELE